MKSFLRRTTALTAVLSFVQPVLAAAALAQSGPLVTTQPFPTPDIAPYFVNENDYRWIAHPGDDQLIGLLRQKIKYVFVIFNENRSFDHEYGTFPGANGIYSDRGVPRPASETPGFTETFTDLEGVKHIVTPFRLGPAQNANFHDSTDHSHTGLALKINVENGVAQMDQFALDEYQRFSPTGASKAAQQEGLEFAELVMSHIDCDTIPFFWRYASRFTLFDNIFATEDTPSTPNAVAMIAGQSGETQWVEHPSTTSTATADGFTGPLSGTINGVNYNGQTGTTQGPPLVNDPQPWWGSEFDSTATDREPTAPNENWKPTNIASNLTFAALPLTFMGGWAKWFTNQDRNPTFDLPDVQKDIAFLDTRGGQPVPWRWYQNGYDLEPTDAGGVASHDNYVSHHNGAQYFGYVSDNPAEQENLRGEGDFFSDIAGGKLPSQGGVFYIRGGYANIKGAKPVIENNKFPNPAGLTSTDIAAIDAAKAGDDDHPSYSDSQLSEAMAARVINAVASNKDIWEHSAIVITYDESDGLWDHVPPRILSYGPDKLPLARGVRIPMLVISPYARVHAVSHAEGDHNAVIETINAIFGLPPLSQLPNEAAALEAGNSAYFNQFAPAGFEQKYLGPRDANSPITDSLLSAFDPARLNGALPPLPGSYAEIPDSVVETFPHYGGKGCAALGIVPEDVRLNLVASPPSWFNTLPSTLPAYNADAPL